MGRLIINQLQFVVKDNNVDGISDYKFYFGELTFYDSSGFNNLNSDKVDKKWGLGMTLPPPPIN